MPDAKLFGMAFRIDRQSRCAVIGYGSWATALVKILLENETSVGWYIRNREVLDFLSRRLGGDVLALPTDRRGNRRLAEHIFLEQAEKFDWPDPEAPESGTEFCHGLRQQLAVLWDGTVVPCCLDGDGRMALGNLYTSSVEEILASPRAAAIREGFSRRQPSEELCRRCGYAAKF